MDGEDRAEELVGEHLVVRVVADQDRGRHEVADAVVRDAADENVDKTIIADPLEQLAVPGERAQVDHGAAGSWRSRPRRRR